jgi:hypothetical protein
MVYLGLYDRLRAGMDHEGGDNAGLLRGGDW